MLARPRTKDTQYRSAVKLHLGTTPGDTTQMSVLDKFNADLVQGKRPMTLANYNR